MTRGVAVVTTERDAPLTILLMRGDHPQQANGREEPGMDVPDNIVKNLLEVIDDVGWYLHNRGYEDHDASDLLARLRKVKHDFENTAKSKDGGAKAENSGESRKRLSPSLNRLVAGIKVQDGNLCDQPHLGC